MSRKRSIARILDDDSSQPTTISAERRRNRMISSIAFDENSAQIRPFTTYPRSNRSIFSILNEELNLNRSSIHENNQDSDDESDDIPLETLDEANPNPEIESESIRDDAPDLTTVLPRHRLKRYVNRADQPVDLSEYASDEETNDSQDEYESDINEEFINNEYAEIFEDYSCPSLDQSQNPYTEDTEVPTCDGYLWILIWIMKFRIRFNISETATEVLIKFIKLVLRETGNDDFSTFPDSLYLARNALGLKDRFHSFAACPKCHKLYNKQEVTEFNENGNLSIMKCIHVEFSNSTTHRVKLCQTPLSQQTRMLNNRIVIQPELIYPVAGIRQQLERLYRRPGFENSLRHWTNRPTFDNLLTDIYDGSVWQSFKGTDSAKFFRSEMADSHLGLMINIDWFQPYDGTIHSTGAVYAVICNLPRNIRFKRKNILLLGLLPGPNEVSLHKINHYLAPIVNELESLWDGVTLNKTHECQEGKRIRAALILVSCDIPAARKICGHVSALVSCHRCEKKANYENGHLNFAGIDETDARSSTQHREDALGWRRCNSDAARKRFVQIAGVRWSELLRLPYFDPIRFLTVDPMHCLFLGIAKWIVKRLWVDEGILTQNSLNKIQNTMNKFQVPADLGRIPGKIYCGEGFSNFTAD